MNREDLINWIWLAEAIGRSGAVFRKLIRQFSHPEELIRADEETIRTVPELTEHNVRALMNKDRSEAVKILDSCERLGISLLPYVEKDYPQVLRDIPDPPALLYYVGKFPDFGHRFCVGMVGTRKMSESGMQNAFRLSYELAGAKALIISGLAEGIDGVCAVGAICGGGETVAVIGCGLDIAYPRHHGKLMNHIVETGGAILSEYPPGTRPMHYHFPIRNRIISGLSQVVIVVEAGSVSGSLITAKEAFRQGKNVYALPADTGAEIAEGNNQLLRDGAKVVLNAQDLVEHYRYVFEKRPLSEKVRPLRSGADRAELRRYGVIGFEPEPERTPSERKTTAQATGKTSVRAEIPTGEKRTAEPKATVPDAVLQSLDATQRAVLEAMPDDVPVTLEAIRTEYSSGEVLAALTMLEVLGIVRKLPGSMYGKV